MQVFRYFEKDFEKKKTRIQGEAVSTVDELYILKEKRKLRRAFMFWDHANIFHILQELDIRIDYTLVKSRLTRGYHLVAPVMYLGRPAVIYPKKQKFFDALNKLGWIITETPLKVHSSGKTSQNGVEDLMFLDLSLIHI